MNRKILLTLVGSCFVLTSFRPVDQTFFELRVYHLTGKPQEERLDSFLKEALIPALHQFGIAKIGVYKPVESDTALFQKRLYVLIPYASLKQFNKVESSLPKEIEKKHPDNAFWNAPFDNAPFERLESILLQSFQNAPGFGTPSLSGNKAEHVYELRSYEGPTEKLYLNKVTMFNDGDEIGLFKRLEFNAVFYGKVLAGSRMPNLMYMTSFNTRAEREEHWKAFVADPQWKTLSAMPEYQHNVSKIDIVLLHPAPYSEI
jgi:NIPSNAP